MGPGTTWSRKVVLLTYWVFPKIGDPKWMVYFMETPVKTLLKFMDFGVPLFLETPVWTFKKKLIQ